MGIFDFFKNVGNKIKSGLQKVFGSETGVLTPTINKVANLTTGGATDFMGALKNATVGGGAFKAIDFLSKETPGAIDFLSKQAGSIPIVGGLIAEKIKEPLEEIGKIAKMGGDLENTVPGLIKDSGIASVLEKQGVKNANELVDNAAAKAGILIAKNKPAATLPM
jgi:hypothetical protein